MGQMRVGGLKICRGVQGRILVLVSSNAAVTLVRGRQTLLFCCNLMMPFTGSFLLGAA